MVVKTWPPRSSERLRYSLVRGRRGTSRHSNRVWPSGNTDMWDGPRTQSCPLLSLRNEVQMSRGRPSLVPHSVSWLCDIWQMPSPQPNKIDPSALAKTAFVPFGTNSLEASCGKSAWHRHD